MSTKFEQKANKKRTQYEQNVNIIFGTHACDLLAVCYEIIAKMYHLTKKILSSSEYWSFEASKFDDCTGGVGLRSCLFKVLRAPFTCKSEFRVANNNLVSTIHRDVHIM